MTLEEEYLADLRRRQDRSWPASVPKEVRYEFGEIPLTDYLRRRAALHPDRVAYVYYGREITFAEVDQVSDRVGSYLVARGVRPGDRVGVMLSNCPQFLFAFYGILKAGAVHVPVNPMFREPELVHELRDSGAALLFVQHELLPLARAAADQLGGLPVVPTALGEYLPSRPAFPPPRGLDAAVPSQARAAWQEVLAAPLVPRWPEPDLDALAALNYTGGTTGLPKGCEHTQRHMVYTAATMTTTRLAGSDSEEEHASGTATSISAPVDRGQVSVTLSFLPVFWIAGENAGVIQPIYAGTTCVLLNRWDPVAVLRAVAAYRVTAMSGTVDNYLELLDHPEFGSSDLSSLSVPTTMSFVTKLSPAIRRRWCDAVGRHSVLREAAYGMTETHTVDTFVGGLQDGDRDLEARPVFCGLPMPGTSLKVVSFSDGSLLPLGAEGEICVRSPSLLTGYWKAPEATAAALRDGWLHTGDIGQLDEHGFLHYLGRNKEMLKVNGMSVFPSEVEALLARHPAVAAAAVLGVPDPRRGEQPVAFVLLEPGAALTGDDLRAWCRDQMAPYKVPLIELVEEMPLTATGKIRKNVLAERLPTR